MASALEKIFDEAELYRQVLRRKHKFLLDYLTNIIGILERLQRANVLTVDECEHLKGDDTPYMDTLRKILERVESQPDKLFPTFFEILHDMGMKSVCDALRKEVELVKTLSQEKDQESLENKPDEDRESAKTLVIYQRTDSPESRLDKRQMAESSAQGKAVVKTDLYKKVLRKQQKFLVDHLTDIDGILDRLLEEDVIPEIKYRDIKEAKTTTEAIRLLIDTLVSQSHKHYKTFLAILAEMKMELVHDELRKEEDAVAKEDVDEKFQRMSLEEKSQEDHYDICILFEDQDRKLAEDVKKKLQEIDCKANEPIKIILYDEEPVFGYKSKSDKLEMIYRSTTMQFYIVPKFEKGDEYSTWDRNSLILQGVGDHKSTVRVLLTEKRLRQELDTILANLQEIRWYDCDLDHFKDKMLQLLKTLKSKRPSAEKKA